MTGDRFPTDRLNRMLTAVDTIEKSLGVLARWRDALVGDGDLDGLNPI